MELQQYFFYIWKWMWMIVLAAMVAATTSFIVTSRSPKVYQATASLMVGQSIQNPNPNAGDIYLSEQLVQTYIQIARTNTVLQGVTDALGIEMSSDALRANVNLSSIQGTQLLQLRVLDSDPKRAQAIANEYARQVTLQSPAEKNGTTASRREFAQMQVDDLESKIRDAQKKIEELQKSTNVTSGARDVADKQQQIAALQSQVTQWQLTYATLLNSLGSKSPNSLSIIEYAELPMYPIAPNVPMSVFQATAIGVMLAVAASFFIEYMNDTLKTPDDVDRSLGLPSLGSIAYIWGNEPNNKLIAANHPRASHSEAYRALRTNIQVANLAKPVRTVMVTSPNPREGKSITAANLAVVMAQNGQRTVLVDADLRRPFQHKMFKLSNLAGLSNALRQQEPVLDTFLQTTDSENLSVITSGPLPDNPAELIDSNRMPLLIKRLSARFDVVLFDTPPCLPRTDAAILARQVEGIVLVLDASYTRRESAVRAKEVITRAGGHILGVVINRIPHNDSYYYYYYYSDESGRGIPFAHSPLGRILRRIILRSEDSKVPTAIEQHAK